MTDTVPGCISTISRRRIRVCAPHDLELAGGERARQSQQLDVVLGPNYRAAVVYSPRTSNFIALEPMVGITSS